MKYWIFSAQNGNEIASGECASISWKISKDSTQLEPVLILMGEDENGVNVHCLGACHIKLDRNLPEEKPND
jgi:hypothetical protein